MKAPIKEKGAILPIIVLILLGVGLFALTKLVNLQQIFKSKATEEQIVFTSGATTTSPTVDVVLSSPFGPQPQTKQSSNIDIKNIFNPKEVFAQAAPTPIFSDDFHNKSGGWIEGIYTDGVYEYINGVFRLAIHRRSRQSSRSKNVGIKEFSVIESFSISGPGDDKSPGINFGSGSNTGGICGDSSEILQSNADCYRLYIGNNGQVELKYQRSTQSGDTTGEIKASNILLENGKIYTLRVDRNFNSLKSWLSSDNGNTWQLLPEFVLDPTKAQTPSVGMLYASASDTDDLNEARFTSFKVYRLGDLPEPNNNYIVSGHVKNASGSPVSGITVDVSNGAGNKVTLQTDSSGVFTTPDFIKQGAGPGLDLYAVRIPDGKGKAVGGDNTLVHAPQGSFDTAPGTASYEFQLAGSNDCSGPGFNNQSGRCDFVYGAQGAVPTSTTGYRISESPDGLQNAAWQSYTSHPMKISHTFSDTNPGVKVLFVQFKSNTGSFSDPKSASIELKVPTSSPTPTPTSSPTTSGATNPRGTLSGLSTAKVGDTLTYNITATGVNGIATSDVYIAKDLKSPDWLNPTARVTALDVANFDIKNFNCDNLDAIQGRCNWYRLSKMNLKSASATSTNYYASTLTVLSPGDYVVIIDIMPTGADAKGHVCSSNPFTDYPVTTGGLTFYPCGSDPIYLHVSQ